MHRNGFPLALAIVAAAALVPAAGAADRPKLPDLPIEGFRLANGLRVVLHRDASVPRVSVVMGYHVGSKDESAGRTGFAHFFEHMMFRGTKNVPNYDIPLQETGSQSNAFTSEDVTVYFETVPSEFLDRALFLEAERLANLPSALDQAKFDTEREVVKNERRQSIDNVPYGMTMEATLAALYPKGHPYSWSVIGSMKDLDAATLDDLRKFFDEFYHPGNAVLVLSGDFDPKRAEASIRKWFEPLPAGPPVRHPASRPVRPKATRVRLADQVALPRVQLVWPTVDDSHPDRAALDLLAVVLAGGVTSRLDQAMVRGSRVAKEISASHDTKEIAGEFTIVAGVNEGRTVAEVEAALEKELAAFLANPPTADELSRAVIAEELGAYASLTSAERRAFVFVLGALIHDDPNHYRSELEKFHATTTADLARVARRYLTPEKIEIVVEPARPGEAKTVPPLGGPDARASTDGPAPPRGVDPQVDWSTRPGPIDPPPFQAPKFTRKALSNGVELRFSRWTELPLVSAELTLPHGSASDPAGKQGLAALTATLLANGTRDRDAVAFARELEKLGASLSVDAGAEQTSVRLSVLARNLAPALALVQEMLTKPRFDPADFEREKQLQLAALLEGPDNPSWIAARGFAALLHGSDHPMGRDGMGLARTVGTITLDDVRRFAEANYGTTGARLIVVGDVEEPALVAAIESTLGSWTRPTKPLAAAPAPRPAGKTGVIHLIDKPGAVQSIIRVGRTWKPRTDPSYHATLVGNHLFGGDFLSRLNQNLRERNGYSYGAGSSFGYQPMGGIWRIGTSVRTDATGPALREILSELDGLEKTNPLTSREVETARKAVIRSFPEAFDAPTSIAGVIAEIAEFGLPDDSSATFIPTVSQLSSVEITEAMSKLAAADSRMILIVGDRKTVEPQLKELKRGEVKIITLDDLVDPR
ncbi:MAG: pitrilysin family protein [Isosphaeraceae bacterium]|nr:pitrilysin family protein [Isosphaeraceae bacterium]